MATIQVIKKKPQPQEDKYITKYFDIQKRLGKGAYGIVWKATDKLTNQTVAIKKISTAFNHTRHAQTTFREVAYLKAFKDNPNIVQLLNIQKAADEKQIYLIFESMSWDLHSLIQSNALQQMHKPYILYNLLNGLSYMHSAKVMHRDLKPKNVLINRKWAVKISDFGLARSIPCQTVKPNCYNRGIPPLQEQSLTDCFGTIWYAAPEMLVRNTKYTESVDMWSVGCILGEMLLGKPLFAGKDNCDQINVIYSAFPETNPYSSDAVGDGKISEKRMLLEELLSTAPKHALNLIKSLLVLKPNERLAANKALCHAYVAKFRKTMVDIKPNSKILSSIQDDIFLSVTEYRKKVYRMFGGQQTNDLQAKDSCQMGTSKPKVDAPISNEKTAISQKFANCNNMPKTVISKKSSNIKRGLTKSIKKDIQTPPQKLKSMKAENTKSKLLPFKEAEQPQKSFKVVKNVKKTNPGNVIGQPEEVVEENSKKVSKKTKETPIPKHKSFRTARNDSGKLQLSKKTVNRAAINSQQRNRNTARLLMKSSQTKKTLVASKRERFLRYAKQLRKLASEVDTSNFERDVLPFCCD